MIGLPVDWVRGCILVAEVHSEGIAVLVLNVNQRLVCGGKNKIPPAESLV